MSRLFRSSTFSCALCRPWIFSISNSIDTGREKFSYSTHSVKAGNPTVPPLDAP